MMIKYFNSLSIHVTQLSRTEKSNIGIHRKCKFLTAVRYSCKSQIGQCKQGAALTYSSTIHDEAQNLTPHEIKTIITRAGEGTKMVFTGDIQQIDSPYLDAQSNGLAYMVDKMKGQELFAHINLIKGERSQLSELASDLL